MMKKQAHMKPTIALLNINGYLGERIAASLATHGYRILLVHPDAGESLRLIERARSVNPRVDIEGIECSGEASWEADVIVSMFTAEDVRGKYERLRYVVTRKLMITLTRTGDQLASLFPHSSIIEVAMEHDRAEHLVGYGAHASPDTMAAAMQVLRDAGFPDVSVRPFDASSTSSLSTIQKGSPS